MVTRIHEQDGRFLIEGAVLIDNARRLMEEGQALFGSKGGVLDLSGVTEVDSAAVSLLMEFRREARRRGVEVRFDHVPENLKSLAQLYGVADLIPA